MATQTYAMLGEHPNCYIRQSVVCHSEVTEETLAAHATDPDLRIRTIVASQLPAKYMVELSRLAQESSEDIHVALLENKNLPKNIIDIIYDNCSFYTTLHLARDILPRLYGGGFP